MYIAGLLEHTSTYFSRFRAFTTAWAHKNPPADHTVMNAPLAFLSFSTFMCPTCGRRYICSPLYGSVTSTAFWPFLILPQITRVSSTSTIISISFLITCISTPRVYFHFSDKISNQKEGGHQY